MCNYTSKNWRKNKRLLQKNEIGSAFFWAIGSALDYSNISSPIPLQTSAKPSHALSHLILITDPGGKGGVETMSCLLKLPQWVSDSVGIGPTSNNSTAQTPKSKEVLSPGSANKQPWEWAERVPGKYPFGGLNILQVISLYNKDFPFLVRSPIVLQVSQSLWVLSKKLADAILLSCGRLNVGDTIRLRCKSASYLQLDPFKAWWVPHTWAAQPSSGSPWGPCFWGSPTDGRAAPLLTRGGRTRISEPFGPSLHPSPPTCWRRDSKLFFLSYWVSYLFCPHL